MSPGATPARAPGCSACAEVAGEVSAPGKVIFDDGLWFVSHHTGPYTDPGELIIKPRRHCESLAELTTAEASPTFISCCCHVLLTCREGM